MHRRQRIGVVLVLSACVLWASTALAGAGAALDWWTLCSGGQIQSGKQQILTAMVGQPIAGTSVQGNQTLCAGYACGAMDSAPEPPGEEADFLYLPAIQNH